MYKKISSGTTIPLLHLYHMLPNQTTNVFVSITEIEGDRNALCAFECVCKTALWVMISNGNISVCMNKSVCIHRSINMYTYKPPKMNTYVPTK